MDDSLEGLRKAIQDVDQQILRLVAARLRLAEKVGRIKKRQGLPVVDLRIEKEVLSRAIRLGGEEGLDQAFSSKLINLLIEEAVRRQCGEPQNRLRYLYDVYEKVGEAEAKGGEVIELGFANPAALAPNRLRGEVLMPVLDGGCGRPCNPQGLKELRKALARDLSQRFGLRINEKQVWITPSGEFGVFSAVLSTVSAGDRVVVPKPCPPVYASCVRVAGGRMNSVPTILENDWRFDLDKVREALKLEPKLMLLCSPNNPTGKAVPRGDLEEVFRMAAERGVYVLSDESCSIATLNSHTSILEIADSSYIHVNTLSTGFGLVGWPVGYVISDTKTIERLRRLTSITWVPEPVQRAALKVLTVGREAYRKFCREIRQCMNLACEELKQLPVKYSKPDGGLYIFPKVVVHGFRSREFAEQLLSSKRVAVVPGEAFGEYPSHLRVSFCTDRGKLKEGLRRIGELIREYNFESGYHRRNRQDGAVVC